MQLGQFSIQSVEILRVIVNEGLFAKSDLLAEYTMEFSITAVSYTHLTLPTSDLV